MGIEDQLGLANKHGVNMACLDLLCGEKLGEGSSRITYAYIPDKRYVVKIEKSSEGMDNIKEFLFAHAIAYTEHAKWICPVKHMSENGRILIMRRLQPIAKKNKHLIPDKIPHWLTDRKDTNFGFIGKQFVCCDYAFSADITMSHASSKLTKCGPKTWEW